MRRAITFSLALAVAGNAVAVPSLTVTSGSIGTGNSLVISGTGFGTKLRSKPWIYADFQTTDGPNSAVSFNTSFRESGNNARITDAHRRWGTGATRSNWNYTSTGRSTVRRIPEFPNVDYGSKYMISYWVKSDINYENAACCDVGETLCTQNWKIGPRIYNIYGTSLRFPNIVSASVAGQEGCGGTSSHDQESSLRITVEIEIANTRDVDIAYYGTRYGFPRSTWRRETFLYEMNSAVGVADGTIIINKNNESVINDTTWRYNNTKNTGLPHDAWVQHNIANANVPSGQNVWWSDIYADDSWGRVEIGNASTYAACTQLEIQPYTSWTNTSISVSQRLGTLSGSKWLYVCDNDNNCNSNGLLLQSVATPAPTITSISPASGSPLGGTVVTLTGTGLFGTPEVTVEGVAATSETLLSATSMTFVVPAGTADLVADVVVTNPDAQTATLANSFTYLSTPAPTITSLSPNHGPAAGGTTITMTGTGFVATPSVTVGGVAATGEAFVDGSQITFVTPAGTAGTTKDVAVFNPDGLNSTSTGAFSYDAILPDPPTGVLLWKRP